MLSNLLDQFNVSQGNMLQKHETSFFENMCYCNTGLEREQEKYSQSCVLDFKEAASVKYISYLKNVGHS